MKKILLALSVLVLLFSCKTPNGVEQDPDQTEINEQENQKEQENQNSNEESNSDENNPDDGDSDENSDDESNDENSSDDENSDEENSGDNQNQENSSDNENFNEENTSDDENSDDESNDENSSDDENSDEENSGDNQNQENSSDNENSNEENTSGDESESGDEANSGDESESDDKSNSDEDNLPTVVPPKFPLSLSLNLPQMEIEMHSKIKGCTINLSVENSYDYYQWNIGDKKISDQKSCLIDFSGYSKGVYPVVLYTQKDDLFFSAIYTVNFDGNEIVHNSARTIMPVIYNSDLSEIEISIENLQESDSENLNVKKMQFQNYRDFLNSEIYLQEGKYSIEASAKVNDYCFNGKAQIDFSENSNSIGLNLFKTNHMQTFSGSGELDIDILFDLEQPVCDISCFLYKQNNSSCDLICSNSTKEGSLQVQEYENDFGKLNRINYNLNLSSGIYWLRINAITSDGKKACYQIEYIIIEENMISKKELFLQDFYDLFSIEYNMNGGFFIGQSLTKHYSSFDYFSLPAESELFKYGYKFTGWYKDSACTQNVDFVHENGDYSGDLSLYAGWEKKSDENPEKGIGLVESSRVKLCETEKSLVLNYSDDVKRQISGNSHIILFNVYNNKNKLIHSGEVICDIHSEQLSFSISPRLHKNEFYLIELEIYQISEQTNQTNLVKLISSDKQIVKTLYAH